MSLASRMDRLLEHIPITSSGSCQTGCTLAILAMSRQSARALCSSHRVTSRMTSSMAWFRAVFDNFTVFRQLHPALSTLKIEEMVPRASVIPIHPGALKYYREAGLIHWSPPASPCDIVVGLRIDLCNSWASSQPLSGPPPSGTTVPIASTSDPPGICGDRYSVWIKTQPKSPSAGSNRPSCLVHLASQRGRPAWIVLGRPKPDVVKLPQLERIG